MKRKIVITADGSSSIFIPELDESYHSMHGAIQEANHVFINNGLAHIESEKVRVFELGYGTGLNAILTLAYGLQNGMEIQYDAIDAHPVENKLIEQLNYIDLIEGDYKSEFDRLHYSEWDENIEIMNHFNLQKIHCRIQDHNFGEKRYNIIYFDAFGPRAQPDMWLPEVLNKMYQALIKGGALLTYCAQGQFRRNLRSIGFKVEILKGPPGKREMTRAIRL